MKNDAKTKASIARRGTSSAKRKNSAIASVKKSGLGIVRERAKRGRLATMRDYATADFKPWTREPGMAPGELVPSAEIMDGFGVSCRMAYGIMLQSRETLIALHSKVDHDATDSLMANLLNTSERLKEIVQMVDGAYLRLLASAAAAAKQGVKFKGVAA